MAQERPVHEIRLGRVKAAIWRNDTDAGVRYGVTMSRIYKTDSGWETSLSFGRDELPLVCKVADLVHTWIYQQAERKEDSQAKTEEFNGKSERSSGRRRETAGARA